MGCLIDITGYYCSNVLQNKEEKTLNTSKMDEKFTIRLIDLGILLITNQQDS